MLGDIGKLLDIATANRAAFRAAPTHYKRPSASLCWLQLELNSVDDRNKALFSFGNLDDLRKRWGREVFKEVLLEPYALALGLITSEIFFGLRAFLAVS